MNMRAWISESDWNTEVIRSLRGIEVDPPEGVRRLNGTIVGSVNARGQLPKDDEAEKDSNADDDNSQGDWPEGATAHLMRLVDAANLKLAGT